MKRFIINQTNHLLNRNTSRYLYRSFTSNKSKDDDYYDAENPETQTFNWFSSRMEKKVNTFQSKINKEEQQQIKQEQERDNKIELNNTFENTFNHYFDLLKDEYLQQELTAAGKEIRDNAEISGANLSLTTLVRVCGKINNRQDRVKELVKKLLASNNINQNTIESVELKNVKFDVIQCHQLLKEYSIRDKIDMVQELFNFIQDNSDRITNDSLDNKVITYQLLVEAYANKGNIEKCFSIVEEMERKLGVERNLAIKRLIISGYSHSNQPEKARDMLNQLLAFAPHEPVDIVSFNSVLSAFSRHGDIDSMHKLYSMVSSSGRLVEDHNTIQYLVEGYLKTNQLDTAIALLHAKHNQPSLATTTQSFHHIFTRLGKLGRLEEMFSLFNDLLMSPNKAVVESLPVDIAFHDISSVSDLITHSYKPNINTINIMIDSCCQCNNITKAFEIYNTLIPKFNLKPNSETFSNLEAISFKLSQMDMYRKYCVNDFHISKLT
ncbi:hypothetical protein CYY_007938 [Polysphondylium violaceum]|uniref:Pentatricopeptide repeat-containing protein-mitochondrial domain-containing protein n=1 Tax=Polysphondylium violaceum TaxID=133409 RepID=A0A8J4V4H6_9MYCE|nr:hypothetical protein CYY_007938 [Polysphondylium violaceum]